MRLIAERYDFIAVNLTKKQPTGAWPCHNHSRVFSFLQRDLPAVGRVLYPGTIPPPFESLAVFTKPVVWTQVPTSSDEMWKVTASHPVWGAAEIVCHRKSQPLPDVLIDPVLGLSASEKAGARLGQSAISVRVQTRQKQVLRDRKRLLWWLRALIEPHGAIAVDEASMLLWSRAMLDDELAHDAELDIESLYVIHAVQDESNPPRVSWLHTHGLEELGAFDIDVLEPSALFVSNCSDPVRALAFAAFEGAIGVDTDRFTLTFPSHDVRLVRVDRFHAQALSEHGKLRELDPSHAGQRAVVCEPVGGLFGRWRTRPAPSRFLSRMDDDRIAVPFSTAATVLMSTRARETLGVFCNLRDEFAAFDLPSLVKLGFEVDGGGPTDREHLWFQVHRIGSDKVDATLVNEPYRVAALTSGQRGEHDLERLTDWLVISPEGSITPRHTSAARRLRENRSLWQARLDATNQTGQ